jgi:hypothetical protein
MARKLLCFLMEQPGLNVRIGMPGGLPYGILLACTIAMYPQLPVLRPGHRVQTADSESFWPG